MTLREAAVVLRISYRHTRRVHRRYLEEGVADLASKKARRGHEEDGTLSQRGSMTGPKSG
ncbi:helix-turn-helix domain-containing protein, partial [bacterium]|nr:helix-turn-helix domain-containing protein [bacterium]